MPSLWWKWVKMSEQDLVNAIKDLIYLRGGIPIRINSGMIVVTSNEGKTRVIKGADRGTADIIACFQGRFLAIECKMPGNKMTKHQEAFAEEVIRAGGIHCLAYSLDDVQRLLDAMD